MRVADLCAPVPSAVRPEDVLSHVGAEMRAQQVSALVVIDGPEGRETPLGVVRERDLLAVLVEQPGVALSELRVADLALAPSLTLGATDMVTPALQKMRAHGLRRAPVVDDEGVLVGVLAMEDVLDWVSEMLEDLVTLMGRSEQRETWTGR